MPGIELGLMEISSFREWARHIVRLGIKPDLRIVKVKSRSFQ